MKRQKILALLFCAVLSIPVKNLLTIFMNRGIITKILEVIFTPSNNKTIV